MRARPVRAPVVVSMTTGSPDTQDENVAGRGSAGRHDTVEAMQDERGQPGDRRVADIWRTVRRTGPACRYAYDHHDLDSIIRSLPAASRPSSMRGTNSTSTSTPATPSAASARAARR